MTRFFKVSLSVIALLLVTLVLFTGCANEALTAAEEAKQAVEDATADLKAAIAKKADADELTAKVEELTAAIEAANALVTDGDIELKTAIDEATKTLGDNAQTLVSTLDVKIAGLLAEKADKATINEQLDKLDALVKNINTVTNGAISIEKFTQLSTTCAYYAYRLEVLWENIEKYEALYSDDDFVELSKAYKTAEVVIYRATSMSVIEQAYANFESMIKTTRNEVDTLYYDSIVPYVNNASAKTTADAEALYKKVKAMYDQYATDLKDGKISEEKANAAKAAMRNYYAGFFSLDTAKDAATENLLEKTLKLFGDKMAADVTALGNRYLVHSGASETYKTDAADMGTARTRIDYYNAQYAVIVAEGNVSNALKAYTAPQKFLDNEARLTLLDGTAFNNNNDVTSADAAVTYIENETLKFFFGEDTEKTLADVTAEVIAAKSAPEKNSEGTAMTTPDVVNAINTLKANVDAWDVYVLPITAGENQANKDRYEANKAPIAAVSKVVNDLYTYLYETVVVEYKAEAQEFIDLVYVPDDIDAGIFDENGNYDFDNNVHFYHGDVIKEAKALADAWNAKWTYAGLDVYADNTMVTASEAYRAILHANAKYAQKADSLEEEWVALADEHTAINGWLVTEGTTTTVKTFAEGENDLALVHNTDLETVKEWYDFFNAGNENNVDFSDLQYVNVEDYEGPKPTEAYYGLIVALIEIRDGMREDLAAKAADVQVQINDLATPKTLATHLAGKTLAEAPTDSAVVDLVKAAISTYKAIYTVENELDANSYKNIDTNNDGAPEYVLVLNEKITVGEGDAATEKVVVEKAEDEYDALVSAANELNTLAAALEIATETENNDTNVKSGMDTLAAKITAFNTLNAAPENEGFDAAAVVAVNKADLYLKTNALKTAGTALDNAVTELKDATDALTAAEKTDSDYTDKISTVANANKISTDAYKTALEAYVAAVALVDAEAEIAYDNLAGYANYTEGAAAATTAATTAYYDAIEVLVKDEIIADDLTGDYNKALNYIATNGDDATDKTYVKQYYDEAVAKVLDYTITEDAMAALVAAGDRDAALAALLAETRAETKKVFVNNVNFWLDTEDWQNADAGFNG